MQLPTHEMVYRVLGFRILGFGLYLGFRGFRVLAFKRLGTRVLGF